MKLRHCISTLFFTVATSSFAADFSAWQFTQSLPVTTAGLTSIDLPAATLNVARPLLDDLRVISPSGIETPLIINWPDLQPPRVIEPQQFEMRLGDNATELDITTGTKEPIRAIHLRPAAARFIKGVRVDSSADGTNWQSLVTNGVVFREPGDVESVVIKLPPQSHERLRVMIDDKPSPPVAFSAARLELGASAPEDSPLPTSLKSREELKGRTRLTLDLSGKNSFVASLRIVASDAVFSRRASVLMPDDGGPDIKSHGIASATLYRIALGEQTTSSFEIPIHRSIASDKLIIDIDNGDSPPLKIDSVEATRHPVRVLFHAGETGNWQLICGHPLVAAPRYDIAAIKQPLASAQATRVSVGALVANRLFEKPSTLPDVDAKGIDIDLAGCRFRKPIHFKASGVIEVELDPQILAHLDSSQRDLRLVQNGRQIPFITDFESGQWMHFVEPAVSTTPDPKRPTVTRWTITMPFDSLMANRLTCISPTPLFDRQISASFMARDAYNQSAQRHLGSSHWTHKPGDASDEFELRFNQDRLPQVFTLETDNGDNAPIEITRVRVHYPTLRLIAKLADSSPAHLYYGNDRATQPRYDLQLVRADLTSAPKEKAMLGDEEPLGPGHAPARTSSAGSPWLWLALAVVVGALLWIVSKMLPSEPKP